MPAKKAAKSTRKKTKKTEAVVTTPVAKRLTKSATDRVVCGVAGGIAEYIDIDPVLIRLVFVLLLIGGGSGVFIYIVLCLILPEPGSEKKSTKEVIKENSEDLEKTVKDMADNAEGLAKTRNSQLWIGVFVILLGLSLFFGNLGIWDIGRVISTLLRTLWPLIIIGVGVFILLKSQDDK